MGHLGLTPQSVNMFGGMKVQGRSEAALKILISEARDLESAGCFSVVLEQYVLGLQEASVVAMADSSRSRQTSPYW
jgi:ketopantoate hydroxymethyltransferase